MASNPPASAPASASSTVRTTSLRSARSMSWRSSAISAPPLPVAARTTAARLIARGSTLTFSGAPNTCARRPQLATGTKKLSPRCAGALTAAWKRSVARSVS